MAKLRLHKSSIVVGLIAALLLALISIPGRVTAVPSPSITTHEHGWPFVYLRRQASVQGFGFALHGDPLTQLPMQGVPWMLGEVSRATNPLPRYFSGWILFADVLLAIILTSIVTAAWESRRRRRPGILSFSLADLLIAMTVVCLFLGWLLYLDREFEREQPIALSSEVSMDWLVSDETCIAPLWIQSLVGLQLLPQFSWRTSAARFYVDDKTNDKSLKEIAALRYVTAIEIMTLEDKRFVFSKLQIIKKLHSLDLHNYSIDENDVGELARLTSLRKLIIGYPNDVDPDVLSRLETELPHCKIVEFDDDW